MSRPELRSQIRHTDLAKGPAWGLLAEESFYRARGDVFEKPREYKNAPNQIERFPFPFETDVYQAKIALEPHDRAGATAALHALFDVDDHYLDMLAQRGLVLARDPSRYQSRAHMMPAQWEAMLFIMQNLARDFPHWFSLSREGNSCHWVNQQLHIHHSFTYMEQSTLPCEPFEYIGRQLQGDLGLFDPREGSLFMDVAMVTEAFHWSVDFIFGMDWRAMHGPVQGGHEQRIIEGARRMALGLKAGQPMRRVNWGTQTGRKLDHSMENRKALFGEVMQSLPDDFVFRTELQQLYRLPQSNAVMFCLRNYLASIRELAQVQKWAIRLHRVFRDFSPDIGRYPFIEYRTEIVEWLSQFDDGRVTSQGRGTL